MSDKQFGIFGELRVPVALGLLRLSTDGRPKEPDAIELIHAALDRGARVLDTADSYGLDHKDKHYGEALVRRALASWKGPIEEVRVATKAGLARPKGRWIPDASPASLRSSVDGALQTLGVERLFLFLLHVNDPRVPYDESLGAIAALREEGKIEHLGLCNVGMPEIQQASRLFPVRVIQNELSVLSRKSATGGSLEWARRNGAVFMAHRPLGGYQQTNKLLKNRTLKALAKKWGVSPHEAAMAILLDQGAPLLPTFGATRLESLESTLNALSIHLDEEDRAMLAEKCAFAPTEEVDREWIPPLDEFQARPLTAGEGPGELPEVVIVMGPQGAGKSERVRAYTRAGYERLNRDLLGKTLDKLVPKLRSHLREWRRRVVLDNTYPTRASRFPVIRAALAEGVPVRCLHIDTPIREARINIVLRNLERHGRLLGPDEMKELAKSDPNLPPPMALDAYARSFEPPGEDEGFAVVETAPFKRRPHDPPRTAKGLLLDVDGTIRTTQSGEKYPRTPDDVELLPGRRETLQGWIDRGYQLFFVSNQSGVASGKLSAEDADACFARTVELLDLPVADIAYCPHKAFPVGCYCRKPLPGLGVWLMERHGLAREHLVMVGDLKSDREFAHAIGAKYIDAAEFFGEG